MSCWRSNIAGVALLLMLTSSSFVARSSASSNAQAETATVEAMVVVTRADNAARAGSQDVVLWLTPLGRNLHPPPARERRYQIVQKDKQFHPHVLAVPVGVPVEFPNLDPWFHNVFSLYKGEKFDLGLYEAGTARAVRFEHPGVSFIFCNIHPEMSAYVLALQTPYFAVSNERGQIKIPDVPFGRYRLEVWYERAESSEVAKLSREITVTDSLTSLGSIRIKESPLIIPPHHDKHGQPYPKDRSTY